MSGNGSPSTWCAAAVRAAALAVLLLAGWSCAPSENEAFALAMAQGHRAHHAGRYEEARAAYERAAAAADRVKDRDEALFLVARTLARAERWPEAAKAYEALVATSSAGPRTARARFEIAAIAIEHGDADRGFTLLERAARQHPTHGLARPAIRRLAGHAAERGGDAGALAWLDGARKTFEGTDLVDAIEYERALVLERMGRLEEAEAAFVAAARAKPYPFGALWDDSLWRAADVARRRGAPKRAIALLNELLAARESPSHTIGSYERPRFSEARMRIAEIQRDELRDVAAARESFHRVFTDHTTSILRDDALWEEARLARAAGDTDDACSLVRLLVDELPESRYVGCVRLLCPAATPPRGARACPDYLARAVDAPLDRD